MSIEKIGDECVSVSVPSFCDSLFPFAFSATFLSLLRPPFSCGRLSIVPGQLGKVVQIELNFPEMVAVFSASKQPNENHRENRGEKGLIVS